MNLIFLALKRSIPELNEQVVPPSRILEVLAEKGIPMMEIPMKELGSYVRKDKQDFVFIKAALAQLVHHETLAYEASHAITHVPADFLARRHNLEAEAMSLICMIPATDLPRLNRIKHQLDPESYELLKRRIEIKKIWNL